MSMYSSDDEILVVNLNNLKDDLMEMKYHVAKRFDSDDTDFSLEYLERVYNALDNLIDAI